MNVPLGIIGTRANNGSPSIAAPSGGMGNRVVGEGRVGALVVMSSKIAAVVVGTGRKTSAERAVRNIGAS